MIDFCFSEESERPIEKWNIKYWVAQSVGLIFKFLFALCGISQAIKQTQWLLSQ